MQNELLVKDLQLRCRFQAGAEDASAMSADAVSSKRINVLLEAKETVQVELQVSCALEGSLVIEGVSWQLADCVAGFHQFSLPPKRTLVKKGPRERVVLMPNNSTMVDVRKVMPHLVLSLLSPEYDIPKDIFHGTFFRCLMRLQNMSSVPLVKPVLKIMNSGELFGARWQPRV